MSKRGNYNQDHYKIKGPDTNSEDVAHGVQRQQFAETKKQEKDAAVAKKKSGTGCKRPGQIPPAIGQALSSR